MDNIFKEFIHEEEEIIHTAEKQHRDFFLECEKHWFYWLMILVGGAYGAYTYSVRGGVFCNAQTANVVLLSMAIGNQDWSRALYLLLPISAYMMGAVASEVIPKQLKQLRYLRWETVLIGGEIIMVIILGLLPDSVPVQVTQVTLNFCCSMQYNTFRQNEGVPMATTFVTNHIRMTGVYLARLLKFKDKSAKFRLELHLSMIGMFLGGGIYSTILCHFFGGHAIWGVLPVLIFIFIRLAIADRTYEKNYFGVKIPHGH